VYKRLAADAANDKNTDRPFYSYFSPLDLTMKFFAFAAIALLPLLQVSQAAPTVKARDCAVIPSTANAAVRDQVYRITQARAVTAKVLLSTFEVDFFLFLNRQRIINVHRFFRPPGSSRTSTTCMSRSTAAIDVILTGILSIGTVVTRTLLASSSSAQAKAGAAMRK
jgi:hypothetical protein